MEPEEIDAALEALDAAIERVNAISDHEARMVGAHRMIRHLSRAMIRLSDIRHFAAVALRAAQPREWPYRRIAQRLGLSSSNLAQDGQAIVRGRRALRDEKGESQPIRSPGRPASRRE